MNDKLFKVSLGVSFGFHVIFLLVFNQWPRDPSPVKHVPLEVVYKRIQPKEAPAEKVKKNEIMKTVKKVETVTKKIRLDPTRSPVNPMVGEKIHTLLDKTKSDMIEEKVKPGVGMTTAGRKITVPYLKSEKISNPRYLSYTERIRNKIRQKAYSFVDNPHFGSGRVYLTFVVQKDGTLKDLQVIQQKSSGDEFIQEFGKKSIMESRPFSPFPNDLDFPELSFNIVISFELE